MRNQQTKSPAQIKQPGKNKKQKLHSTKIESQRKRILDWLVEGKPLNTFEARESLSVMHPSGRVMELKRKGWRIKMRWIKIDKGLSQHRCGQYFLSSSKTGD